MEKYLLMAAMLAASCGSSRVCDPDEQQSCDCQGDVQGIQVCRDDGSGWETCDCTQGECTTDQDCIDLHGSGYTCDLTVKRCKEIECIPICAGRCGGDNGCGGTCPDNCPAGQTCDPGTFRCVNCTPDCTGRECGDDGCGGLCGMCKGGEICSLGRCQCMYESCVGTCCGQNEGCGGHGECLLSANAALEQGAVYEVVGPADLGCHNAEPCTGDEDCPLDASGTRMKCLRGFCAIQPLLGGPPTVIFRGCIDTHGVGDVTHQTKVALYRATEDPTGATPWEADATEDQASCDSWGAFEFTDVPTSTPLILKTWDPAGDFVTVYKYNVILWADLARDDGSGQFVFDARDKVRDPRTGLDIKLKPWNALAVSRTSYRVMLMAVGISQLDPGEGSVLGEVLDCQYRNMEHAVSVFSTGPRAVAYLTNAENPRPDATRGDTYPNGLFAGFGLPAGNHQVALYAVDSSLTGIPLGTYSLGIHPGGVTAIVASWYPGVE